ncbi:MAG: radical SAM protein [Verrucomicrobiae bacterium]|nr:radical SAM protein [Verrucomicrobiae bacterium]
MALDVYLTDACNLRCRYCFNWDEPEAPRIGFEDVCSILRAAYQENNRYVSITGGEPFLYKPIFEVLDFAHRLGYWITILSHGGLLDETRIARLRPFWRLRVRISVDGPDRETHDRLRGEGTFDTTMEKIDLLVRHGINVGVGVTVSEGNVEAVPDILRMCVEKKVAFVRCVPVSRVNKGKAARVTSELHEHLLASLIDFALTHADALDWPDPAAAAAPASIPALTTRRCMAGRRFFGIRPNREIVPCPLIAGHPDVPRVVFDGPESFERLGRQMDALFAGMRNRLDGICSTCEFREVCYGGCLAEKLSFDLPMAAGQPVCTKFLLERLRDRYEHAGFDRLVRAWVCQLGSSMEASTSHACMRHAPFWNMNFRVYDRWKETALRFN